ncbi:hypothetical protein DFH07DRAFT_773788 [Mycena maculata]|uniref:Uncharacterized protein n=1 Tax=Mycena maculata TaxID=230809 RepID=A0AAD7NBZ8_9AGAR|nr:hypothetical protein DFH07DRAFT_773788 [Mycena maculata]
MSQPLSVTDLEDAHDGDSSWLSRTFSFLSSFFPFQSLGPSVDSEDETASDVPAAESRNDLAINLYIDPTELQRLQVLELASQQSNDPQVFTVALKELQELAQDSAPLLPFAFRTLQVLAKFLAVERIPKEASSGDVYERLIFSAVSALWSYGVAKSKNPDDGQLNDACVHILPKALQWINFFHTHFFGDLTQDIHLRENAWGGALVFLDQAVGHSQMFGLSGNEITLVIVKLWVLEADNSFPNLTEHLPARFLHKLITCHGEHYEYMITSAMESVGPSIAAQTAIQHLSSVNGTESDYHFMELRNETLLIRMMICTASPLAHSLLSNGVIRILIKTLSYATRESYTDDPATSGIMIWLVQNSCEALQVAMARTTGVVMCRQALEFGILTPLLRADKWHTRLSPAHFPLVPYIHSRLLIQTLATYTIYPCVLRAAAMAIEKVPIKLQANLDKAGPMRAAWEQFKGVVQRRLQVPGAPVGPFDLLRCSNLFVGVLCSKQFQRILSCSSSVLFLPKMLRVHRKDVLGAEMRSTCQNVDWKNHKKVCKEMQAINDRRPTVPKEETDFAHKVTLHELEIHKNFILEKWRTTPNNHSPSTLYIHPDGSSSEYEEDPRSLKIQVVILNYEQDYTSDKPRPTIGFTSAPMFEHTGLPTMEESAQRYRKEWNAIKLLAEKPQKRGMRAGIVVIRIPEGMFTVRKFFSLLSYSIS